MRKSYLLSKIWYHLVIAVVCMHAELRKEIFRVGKC